MTSINIWWVNQGLSYVKAQKKGFLWAPLRNKAGRPVYHWETMAELKPGDIVLHYADGALRAVSKVEKAAVNRPCPPDFYRDVWEPEGRYVETNYHLLDEPIPLGEWANYAVVRDIFQGPINVQGSVTQGYLFYFTIQALAHIVRGTEAKWPEFVTELVNSVPRRESRNSWIFQGDTEDLNITKAVNELKEMTWPVDQCVESMRRNDIVYIWENGEEAGIIAVGTVRSDPQLRPIPKQEWQYYRNDSFSFNHRMLRVLVRIEKVFPVKITRNAFHKDRILSNMQVLSGTKETVLPLTLEEAGVLHSLIDIDLEEHKTVRLSVQWSTWADMVTGGYATFYQDIPIDLTTVDSIQEIIETFDETLFEETLDEQMSSPRTRKSIAHQLWLLRSLRPGDQIIATHGSSTILGIGQVQGSGYSWHKHIGHYVSVTWDTSNEKRIVKNATWRNSHLELADGELVEHARKPGLVLPKPNVDLGLICDTVASELLYSNIQFGRRHSEVVRSFVVSLATKPLVILTGPSGSGKSQLAIRFGEWLGRERYSVIAVRPDWSGPEALLGYEDALHMPDEHGRRPWHVPEALSFMLRAARDPEYPYLLILDEMNLAHVERYFSDVLSGMESEKPVLPNLNQDKDGQWRVVKGDKKYIPIPQNLFIVGTVNVDETTYMFSPKVLDRANTIEFRVDSNDITSHMRRPLVMQSGNEELVRGFLTIATDDDWHITETEVDLARFTQYLRALHKGLSQSSVQFGHRVTYETHRYASLLAFAGEEDVMVALDLQILQKILPRVHGSVRRVQPVLSVLGAFCFDPDNFLANGEDESSYFDPLHPPEGEPKLKESFRKIIRMARQLQIDQFTSFAE